MACRIDEILLDRFRILERMKITFMELFPALPKRIPRGKVQKEILENLLMPRSATNCRVVTEALAELGYRTVKNEGTLFYRRKAS